MKLVVNSKYHYWEQYHEAVLLVTSALGHEQYHCKIVKIIRGLSSYEIGQEVYWTTSAGIWTQIDPPFVPDIYDTLTMILQS